MAQHAILKPGGAQNSKLIPSGAALENTRRDASEGTWAAGLHTLEEQVQETNSMSRVDGGGQRREGRPQGPGKLFPILVTQRHA